MFKLKFLTSLICLLALYSCKEGNESESTPQPETQETATNTISVKDIEAIDYTEYVLSDLTEKEVDNWPEFLQLEDKIEAIKNSDFTCLTDISLLTSFVKDLKNGIPLNIDHPSINVRLTVLETALLKLESINNLSNVSKALKLEYIKEVLVSHSNLIFQMNKELEKASQIVEDTF